MVVLDRVDATSVGRVLAASGTSDIVDAHVVICARRARQHGDSEAMRLRLTQGRRWLHPASRGRGRREALRRSSEALFALIPVLHDPGRSTSRILVRVTTPVPTRFSDDEIVLLDELVAAGVGETRSAVVRRAVVHLADAVRRARTGASIAASYRGLPQSAEDDALALANAIAMTEAEPW